MEASAAQYSRFAHDAVHYVLSTSTETAAGDELAVYHEPHRLPTLVLRLCDGTSTWAGRLPSERLTPPKTVDPAEFHARLLAGLHSGGDGAKLAIANGSGGGVRLSWAATQQDADLQIEIRLRQEVELEAELVAGQGLRTMLVALVRELDALQGDAVEGEREAERLRSQMAELDSVAARLEAAQRAAEGGPRREAFLQLLNRKKRRIAALERVISNHANGGDAYDGPPSPSRSDSEDEVEPAAKLDTEPSAPAEPRAPPPSSSGGAAKNDAVDEFDPFELL